MDSKLRVKLKKVLKATVSKHWNLERMKDEGCAMNYIYRCEVDTTAVVAESRKVQIQMADGNILSLVLLNLQNKHKIREEVRKP